MQAVNYATNTTPPEYRCTGCGATGVKLWRLPHGANDLLNCVDCMCKREGLGGETIDPKSVSEEGSRDGRYGRSDQIADLMPAIPDEQGVSFWGYSSVPEAGVKWWKALPLRVPRPVEWTADRRIAVAAPHLLAAVKLLRAGDNVAALALLMEALDVLTATRAFLNSYAKNLTKIDPSQAPAWPPERRMNLAAEKAVLAQRLLQATDEPLQNRTEAFHLVSEIQMLMTGDDGLLEDNRTRMVRGTREEGT